MSGTGRQAAHHEARGWLTPDPQPVSRSLAILARARVDLRRMLANGEQVLLLLVIPVLVAVGLGRSGLDARPTLTAIVVALVASAFTSVAIATAFERRNGELRSLAASPLSRTDVVVAKATVSLLVGLLQVGVLVSLSHLAPGLTGTNGSTVGDDSGVLRMVATALLAVLALVPWAFLVAMTLPAERVLVVGNVTFLLLSLASRSDQPLLAAVPSRALALVIESGSRPAAITLVLWGLLGSALARRLARWAD